MPDALIICDNASIGQLPSGELTCSTPISYVDFAVFQQQIVDELAAIADQTLLTETIVELNSFDPVVFGILLTSFWTTFFIGFGAGKVARMMSRA